jgi:hypothetical protein
VGSPLDYEEPLRLLRSLQGSQPSVGIPKAVQELSQYTRDFVERYRATISEKHALLMRRFSGMAVANSASILSKPAERAYVLAVLQAVKRMNDFLKKNHPGTPSSKTHEQTKSSAARNVAVEVPNAQHRSDEEAFSGCVKQENLMSGDSIPVIAGSGTARSAKSPSTSIFSAPCALSVSAEPEPSAERIALADKVTENQDGAEVKDTRKINEVFGLEKDSTTLLNPDRHKYGESDKREARAKIKPDSCVTAFQEEFQRGNSWSPRAPCVKPSNRRSERYLPVQDPVERWISHFGTISWSVCPGLPYLRSLLERSRSKTYGARPWNS